jgi:hypothetical protein
VVEGRGKAAQEEEDVTEDAQEERVNAERTAAYSDHFAD